MITTTSWGWFSLYQGGGK